MPTTTNVTTGKPKKIGGAVYRAPKGTDLPTTALEALAAEFKDCGYISEDGVKNSLSLESNIIKDWGGTVVDAQETGKSDTFVLKFIEALNPEVLKAVHGDSNVMGTALSTGISVEVNEDEHTPYAWVIDQILKGNTLKRMVIPEGTITNIAEIVYKRNEVVGYEVTITAIQDASGNYHYEYMQTASSGSGGSGET